MFGIATIKISVTWIANQAVHIFYGPLAASFSLFSSFQQSDDSIWIQLVNDYGIKSIQLGKLVVGHLLTPERQFSNKQIIVCLLFKKLNKRKRGRDLFLYNIAWAHTKNYFGKFWLLFENLIFPKNIFWKFQFQLNQFSTCLKSELFWFSVVDVIKLFFEFLLSWNSNYRPFQGQ